MKNPNTFENMIEDQKFKLKKSDDTIKDFINDVSPGDALRSHRARNKKP